MNIYPFLCIQIDEKEKGKKKGAKNDKTAKNDWKIVFIYMITITKYNLHNKILKDNDRKLIYSTLYLSQPIFQISYSDCWKICS